MNHRLWGMRCYLGGPMDRAPDGGANWRKSLKPFLISMGVIPLDPCDKPIDIAVEDFENRQWRSQLKGNGKYDELKEKGNPIRSVDLRMVDTSDFLIVNIDLDVFACGTIEELTLANRQKKPIFIRCKQGKKSVPDWLLLMLPHQFIYGNWVDIKQHLCKIHINEHVNHHNYRWKFFDYSKMFPKVSIEESESFVQSRMKENNYA
jgi:nucleoside 2-deoxyribosyltransferase